jgi:hypothetical protein
VILPNYRNNVGPSLARWKKPEVLGPRQFNLAAAIRMEVAAK